MLTFVLPVIFEISNLDLPKKFNIIITKVSDWCFFCIMCAVLALELHVLFGCFVVKLIIEYRTELHCSSLQSCFKTMCVSNFNFFKGKSYFVGWFTHFALFWCLGPTQHVARSYCTLLTVDCKSKSCSEIMAPPLPLQFSYKLYRFQPKWAWVYEIWSWRMTPKIDRCMRSNSWSANHNFQPRGSKF